MIERCPVCGGRGIVVKGFYDRPEQYDDGVRTGSSSNIPTERCRSCQGNGYIRGYTPSYPTVPQLPKPWGPQPYRPRNPREGGPWFELVKWHNDNKSLVSYETSAEDYS